MTEEIPAAAQVPATNIHMGWVKVSPNDYFASAFPFSTGSASRRSVGNKQSGLIDASGTKPLTTTGWFPMVNGQPIVGQPCATPEDAMVIIESWAYEQIRLMSLLMQQVNFGGMPASAAELKPLVAALDEAAPKQ